MRKVILALMFCVSLFAYDTSKCIACHGTTFEKHALGKSAVVKDMRHQEIEKSLLGYKAGTMNKYGMGTLMKGQLATVSEKDIKDISKSIGK
jgi:cytochrome c553